MLDRYHILHISDTHGFHWELNKIFNENLKKYDVLIHSGDCSNSRETLMNEGEVREFIEWYSKVDIANHKIYVAGNHDTSIERGRIAKKDFEKAGIIYLENEGVTLDNRFKIWGSPLTPTFCNWAFNRDRNKLDRYWQNIPGDTDILITHGPPKGILDSSFDKSRNLEFCGDAALLNHVYRVKPTLHCFGHIHDMSGVYNHGLFERDNIAFSNASLVKDGKFYLGLINKPIEYTLYYL